MVKIGRREFMFATGFTFLGLVGLYDWVKRLTDNDAVEIQKELSNVRYFETVGDVPGYLLPDGKILYARMSVNQIEETTFIIHRYPDGKQVVYRQCWKQSEGDEVAIVFCDVDGVLPPIHTPLIIYYGPRGGAPNKFVADVDKNHDKLADYVVIDLEGNGKLVIK